MCAAPTRASTGRPADVVARWAASGAMALTGRADGPALGPPAGLVDLVDRLAADVGSAALERVEVREPLALLAERAAIAGFTRNGATSCGGATRLLRCRDGWIVAALARPTDVELVPAWLEVDAPLPVDALTGWWDLLEREVEHRLGLELATRAALLGLPAAVVGGDGGDGPSVRRTSGPAERASRGIEGALVVDLSSLWAGPMCGSLLAGLGARVHKVESVTRPDGARRADPAFFDLMNGAKRSVALDLTAPSGRAALQALVERADIVIEASRPRALAQLGLGAEAVVDAGWSGVWVSITGFGRADGARVAFGDDAAAAAGLVAWEQGRPRFCADAVADPLTGLAAAGAAIEALGTPGTWLLDVTMAAVAAAGTGPTLPVPDDVVAAPPRARTATTTAAPLGAHTAEVLREVGIA